LTLLGIVTALPIEARQVSRDMPSVELPLHIADHAVLAVSGMGIDKAARAAERLVQRNVSLLVSLGFAGALDPTLRSGSVLLPEAVIGADGRRYDADPEWHRKLLMTLCRDTPVTVSPTLEVNELITGAAQKAALRDQRGSVAIDMESAAVARVARLHQLPFLAIRVVLDDAGIGLPAHLMENLNVLGKITLGAGALSLLSHPGETISAFRLMRALARAKPILRRVARTLIKATEPTKSAPVARRA